MSPCVAAVTVLSPIFAPKPACIASNEAVQGPETLEATQLQLQHSNSLEAPTTWVTYGRVWVVF